MNRKGNDFWKIRSKGYRSLEWATRQGYLGKFIECGEFQPGDVVLDVGTGTGIVAHAVAPLVRRVIGIDTSDDMLRQAIETRLANEEFIINDVRDIQYPDGYFNKVIARMVFHHILEGTEQAMRKCYRVLAPGGRMIFSEGVPPDKSLKDWYEKMFALKEERLTFMEEDLVALMQGGGFRNIVLHTYISRQISIRNWLENSGLTQEKQGAIMQMHLELDGDGQRFYNMTLRDDDVLLDLKHIILVGLKDTA